MKEKSIVTLAIVLAVGGAGYAAVHRHNQDVYHQEQAAAVIAHDKAVAAEKAAAAAKLAAQEAAAKLAAEQAAAKAAAQKAYYVKKP